MARRPIIGLAVDAGIQMSGSINHMIDEEESPCTWN